MNEYCIEFNSIALWTVGEEHCRSVMRRETMIRLHYYRYIIIYWCYFGYYIVFRKWLVSRLKIILYAGIYMLFESLILLFEGLNKSINGI